ncbi:MAG TPA: DUF1003 domain-containing protein [Allosphingosinicella sp.]
MSETGPTVPPPLQNLGRTLDRNIHALRERRQHEARQAGYQQRLAEAITRFTGSIGFVYLHVAIVAFWVAANLGALPFVRAWDPTFVILATVASVEAIFLSTFVLMSQNRMFQDNDRRADLDLQINLLAEHEVTRLIEIVSAIAARLDVELPAAQEIEELKKDVAPEAVLDAIQEEEGKE